MEENNNNDNNDMSKETKSNFTTVKGSSSSYGKKKKEKVHLGFGKSVFIPFISGIIGSTLVIGTCLGVPSIKNKLFGNSSYNSNTSSLNNGAINQVSLSKYSDTSVYAANKILPSIVGIKVEYSVNTLTTIFGMQAQPQTATATGSGIIISDDGYILTNNHIVANTSSEAYYEISEATNVTVTLFNDTTEYKGKIVGKDEQTDLAVIKIDKSGLAKAEFADSDSIKVGEFAMAVGNPLGMNSSVTCGVVSAVNREVTDSDGKKFILIQTDAAINAGNSGGALVNSEGKVIGINTLKLSVTGIEGMGFAIPINSTTDITSQLIQFSKVKRPHIGIYGMDLDEKTAKKNKLEVGIYVKAVDDFSPAEKAGLKPGDVIVEVEGKKIKTMEELNKVKNDHKIGDELKIKVNRDNEDRELTITLGEQP